MIILLNQSLWWAGYSLLFGIVLHEFYHYYLRNFGVKINCIVCKDSSEPQLELFLTFFIISLRTLATGTAQMVDCFKVVDKNKSNN